MYLFFESFELKLFLLLLSPTTCISMPNQKSYYS
jgi:hypothetical protein